MNTITRDYRLDNMLEIIQKAKNVTISDLMILTGKSRATIKRDIRLLKKHYFQIKTKPGVAGGITWEDNAWQEKKL